MLGFLLVYRIDPNPTTSTHITHAATKLESKILTIGILAYKCTKYSKQDLNSHYKKYEEPSISFQSFSYGHFY